MIVKPSCFRIKVVLYSLIKNWLPLERDFLVAWDKTEVNIQAT